MGKAKELAELGDKLTVSGSTVTVSGFNYDNIVDSAPGALDTLNELAAALGDDANFSTTMTNNLATKLNLTGGNMTGTLTVNAGGNDASNSSHLGGDFSTWIRVGDAISNQTQTNGFGIKFHDQGVIHWSVGGIGSTFRISKTNTQGNELFPTGSVHAITINDGGNVGIGTTSPDTPLEVHSGGSTSFIRARYNSGYYTDYNTNGINFTGTNQSFTFSDNGASKLKIASGGNVGIGTTTIGDKLVVQGAASATASIVVQDPTANDYGAHFSFDDANNRVIIGGLTNGAKNVVLNIPRDTKHLGVGTNPQDGVLQIAGTGSHTRFVMEAAGTSSSTDKLYMSYHTNGGTEIAQIAVEEGATNQGQIKFLTGGTNFAMILDKDGNVGIGTDNPATRLHIDESGSNSYATLRLEGSNRGGDIEMYQGTVPVSTIRTDQSGNMYFKTSGAYGNSSVTNKVVLLTGGNVGIGTDSPSAKLNVSDTTAGAYVRIDGASSGDIGSGVQIYKGSTVAASLYANPTHDSVLQSDNGLTFRAGGTNRMRISNTGEIGIGDNLTGTADLHVEKGTNNNTGHFKMGHTRQRRGYVGISSSQNRWYKIMNYANGEIFSGVVQLFHNRGGGFNQTGAYRTYNASVGGYSNGIYGPINATGDSGEAGAGTIEFGTDEAMYLRVNSSIYGGTIYFTFTGTGNGMDSGWQFNVNNYSTSLP